MTKRGRCFTIALEPFEKLILELLIILEETTKSSFYLLPSNHCQTKIFALALQRKRVKVKNDLSECFIVVNE